MKAITLGEKFQIFFSINVDMKYKPVVRNAWLRAIPEGIEMKEVLNAAEK